MAGIVKLDSNFVQFTAFFAGVTNGNQPFQRRVCVPHPAQHVRPDVQFVPSRFMMTQVIAQKFIDFSGGIGRLTRPGDSQVVGYTLEFIGP